MIINYTKEQFDKGKCKTKLPLICEFCQNEFYEEKTRIKLTLKHTPHIGNPCSDKCCKEQSTANRFCSRECGCKSKIKQQKVNCLNCNKEFFKLNCECIKHPNHFCNKSCAAIYNNSHKKTGYRRSKLEIWIEEQLPLKYKNMQFIFNNKEIINSELDIYIPSLKLAFELNGVFHYEPIYGDKKLEQTQNNDHRKFAACIEQKISLCVIDTSKQKKFKINTSIPFLEIICNIIDDCIKHLPANGNITVFKNSD